MIFTYFEPREAPRFDLFCIVIQMIVFQERRFCLMIRSHYCPVTGKLLEFPPYPPARAPSYLPR
ncbi:hypothetical protein J2S03_000826 [Alicyclobacillus cycloheptanicus]|uniref:Uncharacterized protein n=1 Tax=Alicyclobacillus cycloheptanicus TaxID=1457 RepID=A0ABT9XFD3_9BACL|nr:hypothetical protein [Alicyclobacillus cycloheptanicus]